MKKILVVDDDIYIGDMLEDALHSEGYGVLRAFSGSEALLLLREKTPDLILLDLMLPGLSGEELLPLIHGIPVIVVSAKAEISDKVSLLLNGAADYITKPFSIKELLARITVQLRNPNNSQNEIIKFDEIELNIKTHTVTAKNGILRLTPTEFAILKILMQNPKQVVTKSAILDSVSLDTPDCTDSSLKVHISNLRRKLREKTGKEYIEAVWGIGFKLEFSGEAAKF